MRRLHILTAAVALAILLPTLYWCFTTTVGPGDAPKIDRFARLPREEAYELRFEPSRSRDSDPCDDDEMERIRGAITDELMAFLPVNLADRGHRDVGAKGVITFHLALRMQRYGMQLVRPGRPAQATGSMSPGIVCQLTIEPVPDARAAAGGRFRGWKREYAARIDPPASIQSKGGELLAAAFDEVERSCLQAIASDLVSQLRKETR
jgi:hypothetical protein